MASKPIRVVVADDEPIARRGLLRLLHGTPGIDVVGEAGNGTEALHLIREFTPDVAFLDVQMPGGTGIEVAKALSAAERPAIVFVTAFNQFAIDAFELHAVDYLLKPFDDQRLSVAIERVRLRLEANDSRVNSASVAMLNERLEALLASLSSSASMQAVGREARTVELSAIAPETSKISARSDVVEAAKAIPADTFVVRDGERVILLPLSELDWCEAADNYVRLHTRGKKHLIRETMRNIEERLTGTPSSNARFARIHRSMIVNLARVREIKPAGGGEYAVLLADGTKLALSRGYRDRVMAQLGFASGN